MPHALNYALNIGINAALAGAVAATAQSTAHATLNRSSVTGDVMRRDAATSRMHRKYIYGP